MEYRNVLSIAAAALALAGCNAAQETPPSGDLLPPPTPDQQFYDCIAGGDPAPLIGQPAEQVAPLHNGPVRIIPPGGVITQDYDIKRLNLMTDFDGRVLRAYCG